jgi:hypothetical protein
MILLVLVSDWFYAWQFSKWQSTILVASIEDHFWVGSGIQKALRYFPLENSKIARPVLPLLRRGGTAVSSI